MLASTAVRTAEKNLDDLAVVDDLPDLDAVVPCELVEEDGAGGETVCGRPAEVLIELTCPVRHAGCTEQVLVCDEHDRWFAEHTLAVLMVMGRVVVRRVPL